MEYKLLIRRREKGMLQREVAELLGIHPQSYYLKENGKRDFTITEARLLARIFECELSDLF